MFTDAFLIEFGRKVMNILKSIKDLTIYERVIWISSLILILISFVLFESSDYLTVIASMLTIFRSRYYAIAYALNDIILIILWILATMENINYMPMIICFMIFLVNDTYGYIHWKVMEERQQKDRT